MRKIVQTITVLSVLTTAGMGLATEDFAAETGQDCAVCHIAESGGGGLTEAGEAYSDDPESWSPPPEPRARTPLFFKVVHTIILYAHIFFGILWIGTILYVHLVFKPKYALGGLPKSELRLAWLSMPVIALTGILLTLWRLKLNATLFSTVFGKLLLSKILIFALTLLMAINNDVLNSPQRMARTTIAPRFRLPQNSLAVSQQAIVRPIRTIG